jgi:hypothetical protein
MTNDEWATRALARLTPFVIRHSSLDSLPDFRLIYFPSLMAVALGPDPRPPKVVEALPRLVWPKRSLPVRLLGMIEHATENICPAWSCSSDGAGGCSEPRGIACPSFARSRTS